jgi:hypothetical protein
MVPPLPEEVTDGRNPQGRGEEDGRPPQPTATRARSGARCDPSGGLSGHPCENRFRQRNDFACSKMKPVNIAPWPIAAMPVCPGSARCAAFVDAMKLVSFALCATLLYVILGHNNAFGAAMPQELLDDPKKLQYYGGFDAMTKLLDGYDHYTGNNVQRNFEIAKKLIEEASTLGAICAKNLLSRMYYNGEGVEKDKYKAMELLEQSANSGCIAAQRDIGQAYFYGLKGFRKYKNRGLHWAVMATNHPDATEFAQTEAIYLLYFMYMQNNDITGITSLSINYYFTDAVLLQSCRAAN